jgi:hypothetical protein
VTGHPDSPSKTRVAFGSSSAEKGVTGSGKTVAYARGSPLLAGTLRLAATNRQRLLSLSLTPVFKKKDHIPAILLINQEGTIAGTPNPCALGTPHFLAIK